MKATSFIEQKILHANNLPQWLERWRCFGKKIVFTNGCFDLLHAGHIHSLRQAAALGDILIVGLNSDASTRRLKGASRPVNTETDRALLLAALVMVDAVVIFEEDTPLQLIQTIKPDVLVKGGDYTPESVVGADVVQQQGGRVEIIALVPGRSTTELARRLEAL